MTIAPPISPEQERANYLHLNELHGSLLSDEDFAEWIGKRHSNWHTRKQLDRFHKITNNQYLKNDTGAIDEPPNI